jgi:hypothetical protein
VPHSRDLQRHLYRWLGRTNHTSCTFLHNLQRRKSCPGSTNEHWKDTSSRYRDGSAPLSSQASRKMRLMLQRRGVASRLAHKCIMEALRTIEEEVVGSAICGETAQGQRQLTTRSAPKVRDGHTPSQQPTSLLQSFEPLKCSVPTQVPETLSCGSPLPISYKHRTMKHAGYNPRKITTHPTGVARSLQQKGSLVLTVRMH